VLTRPEVLATLRQDFVNAWLLAKDLPAIAARAGDADTAKLCALIQENYGYPVDSVLIAPDLRVVGHVNVHEPTATDPTAYLAFLRAGLAKARGEALPSAAPAEPAEALPTAVKAPERPARSRLAPTRALKLTPEAPTDTILDLIRRGGFGEMSMGFHTIDATAFAGGGTIEITVRVGDAKAAGRFELCAAAPGSRNAMGPVRTLDKVARGETAKLSYEFEKGARFGLATKAAAGSAEGDANAFLATVTVRGR
jgi:hypothetical protein